MKHNKFEIDPNKTVLVLGGRGFIGRHIVEQLEVVGANVLIGTRGKQALLQVGDRRIILHKTLTAEHWLAHLKEVDVVVNAVGIMRQRWAETFENVHHRAVAGLVMACEQKKIRLVHISALGIDNPVRSRFSSSKLNGENAIKRSNADWFIVKPSLVDGEGGYGAGWFRRIAQWPVHIAPANAKGLLTPIDVRDLAEAISKIALGTKIAQSSKDRIYELGSYPMHLFDYLNAISVEQVTTRIGLPSFIVRPIAHICDLLHLTPFSFCHYELLQHDNCPKADRIPEILGRPARRIGMSAEKVSLVTQSVIL
jgi:uncharacterized protein YbjT (DUF2867 family)